MCGDFDNDGFLDLIEVNGWVNDDRKDFEGKPMRFYYNLGTGMMSFREMHQQVGLTNSGQGRALACFDNDHDGDLDVVLVNGSPDHIIYYRNDTPHDNNYLVIELEGLGANRFGIGAHIQVTTPGQSQIRELGGSNNFTSHNPFEVHFGLGNETVATVEVTWPDQSKSRLDNVAVNQRLNITATETNLRLVVFQGEGTGTYGLGERITIQARQAEEGYYFSHWSTASLGTFDDVHSEVTVFTMPNSTVSVEANFLPGVSPQDDVSVARRWMEVLLQAIRNDYARPTVHERNLFHVSAAMYDAWSAYRSIEQPWLLGNTQGEFTCDFDQNGVQMLDESSVREAISFAAYRIIRHRFVESPGASRITRDANALLGFLGLDRHNTSLDYSTDGATALGNYIADCYIRFGMQDGSNEVG